MKVIVVGLGVGMAHICALVRTGNEVIGIVDKDSKRLESARKEWKNRWLDVIEEVEINPRCKYSDTLNSLGGLKPDLIVIATPPSTQMMLYTVAKELWPKSKYLLEKPLVVDYDELDDKTFISTEWIFNPELTSYTKERGIRSLEMCYPLGEEPWKVDHTSYEDMLPHLISILWANCIKIDSVIEVHNEKDLYIAKLYSNNFPIDIVVARPPRHEVGTYCNGVKFDWYFNTFDEMYTSANMLTAKTFSKYNKEYEEKTISCRTARLS